jgi:polyhydroxyalkanoate synthesis repressor PhaR
MPDIARLIRRYESRKLYDTEESRYVSLEELATWVRAGQQVRVVDVATDADVTAQTLTQIILEEGKRGAVLSTELLHDLVRRGERAVVTGVHQVKVGVEHFVQRSIDRLAPVQKAREEMADLKARLVELEASLSLISSDSGAPAKRPGRPRKNASSTGPKARKKGESK